MRSKGKVAIKYFFSESKVSFLTKNAKSINQVNQVPYIDIYSRSANSILQNLIEKIRRGRSSYVKPSDASLIPLMYKDNFGEQHFSDSHEDSAISNLNTSIRLKYYLQWTLVILVHLITFWYMPSKSNNYSQGHYYCDIEVEKNSNLKCNEVRNNVFLIMFYLLYCFYFYCSALQIRHGYPELKKGNFLMSNTTPLNKVAFQIFLAVPFLLELKIFTDWSFTKTGLDVFQWIKFENIYGDLFIAK